MSGRAIQLHRPGTATFVALCQLAGMALVTLACLPACDAQPAAPGARPELRDEWLMLSVDGRPGGYMHAVFRTREDGLLATWTETRFRLARMGQELTLTMETTALEDAEGHVHRLGQRLLMPDQTVTSAEVRDGRLLIDVQGTGASRRVEREWPAGHFGPEHWLRGLVGWAATADPGQVYVMRQFDLQIGAPVVIDNELLSRDAQGFSVATSIDALPGMVTTTVHDWSGRILRQELAMLGMAFRFEASTRERVLEAFSSAGLPPETFAQTVIRPDRPLERPRELDRVVLRLSPRDPSIPMPAFDDPRQEILEQTREGLLLEIRRRVPDPARRSGRPGGDVGDQAPAAGGEASVAPPGAEALEPNATIQSDDPLVVSLARELAGDAREPWEVAQRLEQGVHEYVSRKSFGVAFASASEVCRTREGDCSEHAVLLAALARARGIPSRVAMGLTYVDGVFGGHAWTEVWINGGWFALDATTGLGSVDATHIGFATSTLAGLGMGAEMFAALLGLANLDIAVVETERAGQVERP